REQDRRRCRDHGHADARPSQDWPAVRNGPPRYHATASTHTAEKPHRTLPPFSQTACCLRNALAPATPSLESPGGNFIIGKAVEILWQRRNSAKKLPKSSNPQLWTGK